MATVTKRPYTIPKHKYWLTIEDKYLVDYSEDIAKDVEEERIYRTMVCARCNKLLLQHRHLRFCTAN